MSSYSFVDAPNDNLNCCICRTPFIEPLKTSTCGHTFCKECIYTALSVSSLCPIDRWPLAVHDLTPADPLVRNLVDELLVYCPNSELGCPAVIQRQLLAAHLSESCLFTETNCEDGVCEQRVQRQFSKHSLHTKSSDMHDNNFKDDDSQAEASWRCAACKLQLKPSEQQEHRSSCLSTTISCPHASHGCSWEGTRGELSTSHLPICSYEAIKGFFDIFSSKLQGLRDENTLLRRKVATLEGTVSALTSENEDVKRVLGPWFSPHDQRSAPAASVSRYAIDHISDRFNSLSGRPLRHSRGTSIQTDPLSGSGVASSAPEHDDSPPDMQHMTATVPRLMADPSDLASYFPPPDIGDYVPAEDEPRNSSDGILSFVDASNGSADVHYPDHGRSPSSQPSQLYPDPYAHGYSLHAIAGQAPLPASTSPPHVPTVAPLNLGTSLHRTLLSLRESVVTLSTTVDSLARRQDVVLTAESMRLNEEIRSLRVVIHGLRMQMHSIMMDRNAQIVPATSAPRPPGLEHLPNTISPAQVAAAGWASSPVGPVPFTGPRFPSHAHPPNQSSSVSGPKL